MKQGLLLLFGFSQIFSICLAQNLIPNPGFEEKHGCPEIITHDYRRSMYYVQNWENAHGGSCDYLHTCIPDVNFKQGKLSFLGEMSAPRTGQAYIGLVVYTTDKFYGSIDYREIPLIELTQTLEKEVEYELEINIKLAPKSTYSISNFNVYFVKDKKELITENNTHDILVPSMMNKFRMLTYQDPITDTSGWTKISFLYIAQGGENYLIMGNFISNERTISSTIKKISTGPNKPYCYYFIDDMWLSEKGQLLSEHNFEIGNSFVLNNVHFETGSAEFSEEHFYDLDNLADIMKEYPEYDIKIMGHTDKEGDQVFNRQLSFDRAKNVRSYLESKGIEKSKMKILGMGSINPIASNKTESGKSKNRRVEIEVIRSE